VFLFCTDKIGSLLEFSWLTTLLLILDFMNAGTLSVNEGIKALLFIVLHNAEATQGEKIISKINGL
jgi:hypothetical protein